MAHLDALDDAHAHLDRKDQADARLESIHRDLVQFALDAFTEDNAKLLDTPSDYGSRRKESGAQVWAEFLSGDYERSRKVLQILCLLDQGKGGQPEARLMAQALLTEAAKDYADSYADILAGD